MADEVALFFETPAAGTAPAAFETVDADHGRIETRRHHVSHDVDWLTTDRRFPGEPRFPGLKAIAMVEATVERRGTVTTARRYFLSSMPLDPRTDPVGLRAACLGPGVVDVLDRQVEFVLVPIVGAAEFCAAIGEHAIDAQPRR